MTRCGTCHARIAEGEEPKACPACRQEYHAACWAELGGCGTYGCEHAVQGEKPAVGPSHGGWGDSKTCPSCNGVLHPSAMECRCGAKFPRIEAMTRAEYTAWTQARSRIRTVRRSLVAFFVISLFGIPAPVIGIAAGILAFVNRKDLAGEDGTYLALGYGAAALGVTHALAFALIAAGL